MPPYPGYLMRVGVRGDNVRQVQECLNRVQNAGLATDGIFGPLTDAAVRNFQRANGLNADGIVGPLTWNALMSRCVAQPQMAFPGYLMRVGVSGDNVRRVQECLNQVQNAQLATDGVFGPLTDAAVRNFQSANGLNADGIVGPLTWNALMPRCGFAAAARTSGARMLECDAIPAPCCCEQAQEAPVDTMPEVLPECPMLVSPEGIQTIGCPSDAPMYDYIPLEHAHPVPPLEPAMPLPTREAPVMEDAPMMDEAPPLPIQEAPAVRFDLEITNEKPAVSPDIAALDIASLDIKSLDITTLDITNTDIEVLFKLYLMKCLRKG
jgi:hypothetical protein